MVIYRIFILVFFVSIIPFKLLGQEKSEKLKFLQFRNFDVRGVNKDIIDQIKKTALSAGMSRSDYELLIGAKQTTKNESIEMHEIRLRVVPITWAGGSSKGYLIEGVLIDVLTETSLNRILRARVPSTQIVFTVSQIFNGLLSGQKEELRPLDFELDGIVEPLPDLADPPANKQNAKPKGPKGDQAEKADVSEEGEIASEPPDAEPEVTDSDKNKDPKKNPQQPKKNNLSNSEVKISNFDSPDIDLTRGENVLQSESTPWVFVHSFDLGLIYGRESISSVNIIDVSNNFSYSGILVEHYMNLDGEESNSVRSKFSLRRLASASEFEISPRISLESNFHLSAFSRILQPFIGLKLATSSFVNLAVRGEGFKNFGTTALWAEGGLYLDLRQLGFGTTIGASIGKTFLGSTDYSASEDGLEIQGDSLAIFFSQKVWSWLHLFGEYRGYEFTSISLQDFKNSYQEMSFGLLMRF